MSAVRDAEGIVNGDVRKRGKLLGESGIVLLLFLVIAQVFEEQNLTRLQVRSCLLGLRPYAIGRPLHILLQEFRKVLDEMLRRELLLLRLRRATDVAREDQRRAAVKKIIECRQRAHHARVIRDIHLVVKRHIVIDAHENLLALDVDILNRLLVHKNPPIKRTEARPKRGRTSWILTQLIFSERRASFASPVFRRPLSLSESAEFIRASLTSVQQST